MKTRAAFGLLLLVSLIAGVAYQGVFPEGLTLALLTAALPLLSYMAWVKSPIGSLLCGFALLATVIGTAVYVAERMESGSSTAGVGYLYLPMFGLPLVLLTVLLEGLTANRKPGAEP